MRLYGYIEGTRVEFERVSPDLFQAEFPRKYNSIYVIELHAIDDAGNEGFYTDILVQIDFKKLTIKELPVEYSFLIGEYELESEILESIYKVADINNEYSISDSIEKYRINDTSEKYSCKIL